jgi:molybdopterin-biosynthesis enzyme MoeA-like protein
MKLFPIDVRATWRQQKATRKLGRSPESADMNLNGLNMAPGINCDRRQSTPTCLVSSLGCPSLALNLVRTC